VEDPGETYVAGQCTEFSFVFS